MQVIDNFLPEYHFKQLQSIILSNNFSWYWNDNIIVSKPKTYQFTHGIYISDNGLVSKYYSSFDLVQQKLGVRRLDKIKVNLNPKTVFHRKGGYHTDNHPDDPYQHTTTAVLYLNTNNGWTEFKKGGKVKSVAKRIVIFYSNV